MKRFVVILCALSLFLSFSVFAENTPALTSSASLSEDGQTVTLVVHITDGSEICAGGLDLVYDPDLLVCESVSAGSALKNTTFVSNAAYDTDTIRVAWMSTSGLSSDGEVITVTFRTHPGTKDQTVQLTLSNVSAFDIASDNLVTTSSGTSVVIPAGEGTDLPAHPSEDIPVEDAPVIVVPPVLPDPSVGEDSEPEAFFMAFTDVTEDAYYYDAVRWAIKNSITTGTSETTFSPAAPCNRAQIVTFLWRAAGCPRPSLTSCSFTDVTPGAYYYDAMLWAIEQGITNGTSATTFSPDAPVTRSQVVTFLWRSAGWDNSIRDNPFHDVPSGAYYETAVCWAVGKGITTGTSSSAFSPDAPCVRSQIVTFLYRDFLR